MIKLHIGSGDVGLPGWINLDLLPYPNVDRVWDLRKGLPYRDVSYIYSEHFVEHLTPDEALSMLRACRQALSADGILRVSTPNLDWVLETHYRPAQWQRDENAVGECFALNKAFHGWGHKFLFNKQTLTAFLRSAGFANVRFCAYGESSDPQLAGLERHPVSIDTPTQQHVIVAEAFGVAEPVDLMQETKIEYRRDTEAPFHALQYSVLWTTRAAGRIARAIAKRLTGRQ